MVSSEWPVDVIDAAVKRNLVIFVGSGVSRNSSNDQGKIPPTWAGLLNQLAERLSASNQSEVNSLVARNSLLEAAECLMQAEPALRNSLYRKIAQLTDGVPGAPFRPNDWHEALMMIDPHVIVTTNYDKILERMADSTFDCHSYASETVAVSIRGSEYVLIKLHGSVDAVQEIVLTQSDYTRIRDRGRGVLSLVEALLLTRVALFVGYSVNDPDIKLILRNVVAGHEGNAPHYLLTSQLSDWQKGMLESAFGLSVLDYGADHSDGLKMLQDLASQVQSTRPH